MYWDPEEVHKYTQGKLKRIWAQKKKERKTVRKSRRSNRRKRR
jgi:hypothetical protein